MINKKNLGRFLHNPSLLTVIVRRIIPWKAKANDPECRHLIEAWSSGSLPRVTLTDIFPDLKVESIILRKSEERVVGWSLDLQELAHLLALIKFTQPKRLLEVG